MKNACFVLRAEPFHNGHLHIIKETLKVFDKIHIVLGSANRCRSPKNPFTVHERRSMIRKSLKDEGILFEQYEIHSIADFSTEQKWNSTLIGLLDSNTRHIVGYSKDESSAYLKKVGSLEFYAIPPYEHSCGILNATDIREELFSTEHYLDVDLLKEVPDAVKKFLTSWKETEQYTRLRTEYWYYRLEEHKFSGYPYPDALNCPTADAVVMCSGHVLLVTRKSAPGQGLLALAGGHKNSNETFEDCAIRELIEETNIKLSERTLRKCIKDTKIFDDPNRSQLLCKPTVAHYIEVDLNPDGTFPKVRGADDAAMAKWYPLSYIKDHQTQLYDDHSDIIDYFTGCL